MKNWFSINIPDDKLKELEEKIERNIKEKINKKQFTLQDIEDLKNMNLEIPPDPRKIRPFFLKEILPNDSLFFHNTDYNLTPELIYHSSTSKFLSKIRKKLQPIVKIFANIEAVIHKQAVYNEKQVEFNTKIIHHIKLMHNIINYLVAELTKLKLEQEELAFYAKSLEHQLNFQKEYQKALDEYIQQFIK
jgi:hypothetical protein